MNVGNEVFPCNSLFLANDSNLAWFPGQFPPVSNCSSSVQHVCPCCTINNFSVMLVVCVWRCYVCIVYSLLFLFLSVEYLTLSTSNTHSFDIFHDTPRVGPGHPSSPLVHLLSHLFPFLLFSFFHWFYLFLLLSIPSLSTRIVSLRFQAGGCRRRPNLGLVCFLFCTLCYLYSLVKMYCGACFVLFGLVFLQCFDTVGWVIWPVKTRPHMTYNVLVGR